MSKRHSRIGMELTSASYQKLIRRANYLGTTPTSIVYLMFYLYQDIDLSEGELEEELNSIQSDTKKKGLAIQLQPYLENIIKVKRRYFFTNPQFISAYCNRFLKNGIGKWKELEQKQGKRTAIFLIDSNLNEWFVNFSKETKISQTTLLNYALMVADSDNFYVAKKSEREEKGVYLTESSLETIEQYEYEKRASIIENCIRFFQDLNCNIKLEN
ncbi:MAG: hypothetical protein L0K68_09970 [Tetragenococcus koreensis]|nr:hypothetical protein [Tetragenococcus koreensis]